MEQRPPSSRPRSSAGRPSTSNRRPKTAGRDGERPALPRPPSRLGAETVGDEVAAISVPFGDRTVSRSGTMAPGSAMGFRTNSRSGLRSSAGGMAARPGTGMVTPIAAYANPPPGTGMHRPVTQQGLTGVRTQSRMGTAIGGNRQVLDKTYYIALLNNHLQSLEDEISSLLSELDKTEKGQQNLLFYEQRAEEQANELKELQGELSDLNLIIDRLNTNSDLRDLEFEVAEAEKANNELTGAVEDLFKERQEKEDFIRQLEGNIHAAKVQNAELINSLDRGLKGEFERVQTETEELRQSLEEKHRELDELNKTKEELDLALANSSLKQQAMVLEEQINELEEKRNSIMKELRSEEPPEEQRQNLIQRIQKDNEEIAHMQTQLQEMNERITQAQEEFREFQNEFEILAVDKSERFRELKNRDAYMDTFLDQFNTLDAEVEGRINELSTEIVRLLNLMSLNCLDESIFSNSLSNPGASASELQDLHVRLEEELISLQMTESRLHTELDAMQRKQVEIEQSLENFDNQEQMREQMDDKRKVLEEQRSNLRKQYAEKEAENSQIAQQVESVERLLSQSALYPKVFGCVVTYLKYVFVQLKELKRRVEVAEDERLALKLKLDAQIAKNDYEPLKQQALRLRNDYNTLLCAKHSSSTLH
ncbi:intraflagellar transport protein 74 like protein [Ditylenchus destructor]|uniref:Intraflagellar transport protein 74 like protein n=1 Tax=Ditylenchus destructor TaxID=166010 RepID=A0AAD4NCN1_9BILA|nr:intraflagellar transport protein 74 like protein [Ditylenchus destructor]